MGRTALGLCLALGLGAVALGAVAWADEADRAGETCEGKRREARLVAVEPGLTLVLDDGARLRLADLVIPAWPDDLRAAARRLDKRLARHIGDTLAYRADGTPDARGRQRGQVWVQGGWLQADLVSRGLARVAPERHQSCAAPLAAMEADAAARRSGAWSRSRYWPTDEPWPLTNATGTYQVFRGTVHAVAKTASGTYVNFGPNRWTDITALVTEGAAKRIGDEALAAMAGREVVLRGWVRQANGPMIDVRHPLQLRLHGAGDAEAGEGTEDLR